MDTYRYKFNLKQHLPHHSLIEVGVAGSGNLEVIIDKNPHPDETCFTVNTIISGFKSTWDAVIERFIEDYPFGGLSFTLNDAGASPPVVSLRLRQAIETCQSGYPKATHYLESSARGRIYSMVDEGSFSEFLPATDSDSPNLPALNIQIEADDGVVIGTASIAGHQLGIISQQKDFIGGSVGEAHGAKIIGMIHYAIKHKLDSLVFLIDSGGVRLQEANVGEIEISEIVRAVLEAKSAGIKTIGVICGNNGAYGGMAIISGCLDYLIVNQVARIGVSGADVIQAVKGAEAFNSSDRPLVWRVYGGRTRFMQQAVHDYTSNLTADIREAIVTAIDRLAETSLIDLEIIHAEHEALLQRIRHADHANEQGEWLKQHHPNLYKQDVFNMDDKQFLAAITAGRVTCQMKK